MILLLGFWRNGISCWCGRDTASSALIYRELFVFDAPASVSPLPLHPLVARRQFDLPSPSHIQRVRVYVDEMLR
jgi:hypothetical protein